ncbi:MAG TPA: hypothetical protein ENI44_03255 [Thermoplasmatales archaeon]|nr:hypothetical protein [Thermoplasmatales archaeon]
MPPDLRNAWDVIIPNPLKIVEAFENTLDKDIAVKGDAVFNLYFISNNIHRDKVKVGIYSWNNFIFPHEIKNKTVFIKYNPISRISRQRVRLKEVNCTLHPGDALLFLVEIIPSNKTITKILERRLDLDKLFDRWRDKIQRWEDSNLPLLIRLANLLNFTILMFNEFNLSERDVVEILNDLISSSIVYDSIFHPSSVTLHLMLPIWREYMDKDYVSRDLA